MSQVPARVPLHCILLRLGVDNDDHCPLRELHCCHSLHSMWCICKQHSWPHYTIRDIWNRDFFFYPFARIEGIGRFSNIGAVGSVVHCFLMKWEFNKTKNSELLSLLRPRGVYTSCLGAEECDQQDWGRSKGVPAWERDLQTRGI